MKNYKDSLLQIEKHLQYAEYEPLQGLLHSIKGNAGNIGARGLHSCASRMEQACMSQDLATAMSLLREFESELIQVLNGIARLPPVVAETSQTSGRFDEQVWLAHLDRMIQQIDTDLGAAMDAFSQLQELSGGQFRGDLKCLEDSLNNFDTDAVKKILLELRSKIRQ